MQKRNRGVRMSSQECKEWKKSALEEARENVILKLEITQLKEDKEKLIEALEFYGNPNNWSYGQIIDDISEVNGSLEAGKLARKVLSEVKE
jgi:hypothetical protein